MTEPLNDRHFSSLLAKSRALPLAAVKRAGTVTPVCDLISGGQALHQLSSTR